MDKFIVENNTINGGVRVHCPVGVTTEEEIMKHAKAIVPEGRPFVIVDREELPSDNRDWLTLEVNPDEADGLGDPPDE
jgi:hypothetical protein